MTFDRFRVANSEFHDQCQFVNEKKRDLITESDSQFENY